MDQTDIDNLVYGKAKVNGIVGLEVNEEGHAELFIQEENGNVISHFVDNRFWLLSDRNLDGKFSRLDGNLHYKWGRQFQTRQEYVKWRSIWRNKDIYSIWSPEEALMVKDGYCFYQGLKPNEISLLSFDIETTGLDGKAKDATILMFSTTFRDTKGNTTNKLFAYDEYDGERELIKAFCDYVKECNPSLLVGHNILSYDFPYIQDRCDILDIDFSLGRDNSNIKFDNRESKFRLDGTRDLFYKKVSVYGREIVDTYFLAVSFDISKSFETYGLKALIKQLKFEKEGRQHYDASLIRVNYKNPEEWKKIKQYAIDDAEDPVKLWDLMGAAKFYWCQKVPKPMTELLLGATGSQINSLMLRSYLQDRHSIPKADEITKYDGAISIGIPGAYTNCIRWDVASLYPSIIIQYSVYDQTKDPKANFLTLVRTLTKIRLEHKKLAKETGSKYYSDLEQSEKIGINSAYGFLGATGLNFNCLRAADFITEKGREILMTGIKWATGMENEEILHLCDFKSDNE